MPDEPPPQSVDDVAAPCGRMGNSGDRSGPRIWPISAVLTGMSSSGPVLSRLTRKRPVLRNLIADMCVSVTPLSWAVHSP